MSSLRTTTCDALIVPSGSAMFPCERALPGGLLDELDGDTDALDKEQEYEQQNGQHRRRPATWKYTTLYTVGLYS